MSEILLTLYGGSKTLFSLAFIGVPVLAYYLFATKTRNIALSLVTAALAMLYTLTCFIPLVIPENHHYDIVPNVLYAVCIWGLLIWKLSSGRTRKRPSFLKSSSANGT